MTSVTANQREAADGMRDRKSIEYDDLELFLKIIELGSVNAAAQALHRPPQTARDRLFALEDFADCDLFERSPNGLTPNAKALCLEPYAREAVDSLLDGLRHMRTGRSREELEIAVHSSTDVVGTRVIEQALEHFDVTITVTDISTRELLGTVLGADYDFAFGPFNQPPPGVECLPFGREEVLCVVTPQHPLAGKDPVYLADLNGFHVALEIWDDGRLRIEFGGNQMKEGTNADPDKVVRYAATSSVENDVLAGNLVPVTVVDLPRWSRELHVAFRRDVAHTAAVRTLRRTASTDAARTTRLPAGR